MSNSEAKPGSIMNMKRHSASISFVNDSDIGYKYPRTSKTHPLNISWILNDSDRCRVKGTKQRQQIPQKLLDEISADTHLREEYEKEEFMGISELCSPPSSIQHGNFALSSCPGKKVRLTGPTRGKAMISRDLDLDFQRIASFNIKTVICAAAKKNDIHVIRCPIVEGYAPDREEDVNDILVELDKKKLANSNVLCHCRGGIGRAAVIACCFLLRKGYCSTPRDSIAMVRQRRSSKAIETIRQENFIISYHNWLRKNKR
ncbi:hypothetical protein HDV04_003688 [Boothiomyces sp. JEL0838]|nr:hypothetical protein HDV04_003688 [Boothiomyces sp. JEL0838]